MKKLILIFISFSFFSNASYSQEPKICEDGIEKCAPLTSDSQKYSRCMKLMCYDYYSEKEKKEDDESKYFFKYISMDDLSSDEKRETVKPCEYGLRKCDILQANKEHYWECVSESCKNPSDEKPDCELGTSLCVDKQKIYNDCMKLTCGSPVATFYTCPDAKAACYQSFRSYWHCVYGVCLGSVDEYMRASTSKKYIVIEDKNGKRKRILVNKKDPIMMGVPQWAAVAPKGIDPDEWVHSLPQKFMLRGNPSETMRCLMPSAIMSCESNDMRSCICNDGTAPIMLDGVPSPKIRD